MALIDKDRLVAINRDTGKPDDDAEVWDVVEAAPPYQARDDDGQLTHVHQIVVVRLLKVK